MSRLFSSSSVLGAAGSKMASFGKVTHCIFDMDGLLLDTEVLYTQVTQSIAEPYGKTYTWEIKQSIMGLQRDEAAEAIVAALELPLTPAEYVEVSNDLINRTMEQCQLMPGAERLVRHLHRHNVPIALATSSGVDSVEVKTKNHRELFELFGHKVMGSSDPDVKEGKPAPDIFLVAASRFADSPPPDRCLVFEDAPNGVTAAIAAGMQAVMVPDPRVEEDQRKHATLVLRSLEDFQPEQFGLPPFST
ncbi:probable pseudouridine-5'-phosphatase isoform X1 [Anopheles bellator]|uniref:probable pseudouridine-5'-phosphatase isoform X1 n=1 Tax=Anopheles bellator TaxID=139047 RepID=UPI0026477A5C|nr:probable pseudouridine-5'-phosphatase isoform X1 [Anopheles bellator]XP_058062736.1 probable pseudouridine-5'-phosphatase isoform X1 [Anopheles bellator]XP_058062737.1 probable pseudouridine-5'-phosphatase isoform X1 [Anopheles bellator]